MTTTTIAAIATATGQAGVAIVRLSGKKSYHIGLAISHKTTLTPRYAHFVNIYDVNGEVLDEAVMLYFKAPHSFTGEDVLEIQCHGGMILPNLVLARCFELGAKQASAGEFSYRAFDNDKLDLVQAESIADAISATSVFQARSAIRSLSGEFSHHINQLTDSLIHIRLYVEAMIDFSDEEDVDFLADGVLLERISHTTKQLQMTLAAAEQGVLLKEGVQLVLAGRPNAGKSSLLNRLAGTERAIVTPVAGTTRDTLEECVVLNGLTCYITDTAGLHKSDDIVEQIGIARAKTAINNADVVLFLYDLSETKTPQQLAEQALETLPSDIIFIGNKVDLTDQQVGIVCQDPLTVHVSCSTGAGIDDLIDAIGDRVGFYPNDSSIIARTRHVDALKRTLYYLDEAKTQLTIYQAGELSAESLKLAQRSLSEITGEFSSDELLGRIFSHFCIGK